MSEFLQLLKTNRNYRYTWSGQVVSEIGDHFNNVAVFALAFANTRSGLVVTGHHAGARRSGGDGGTRSPACCSTGWTASAS